ncbi:MAG: hypothetical protein HRT41_10965 [Campylobacteraceae bacterium]|nr:hypothetical protein [Campylobacteraceae bacterium]
MRIALILVLSFIFVFLYQKNSELKKNAQNIKQALENKNSEYLQFQEEKKELLAKINKLELDLLFLKKNVFDENKLAKPNDILEFQNQLKTIKEKEKENNFTITPNIKVDKENKSLKLEGLQIEIKSKF